MLGTQSRARATRVDTTTRNDQVSSGDDSFLAPQRAVGLARADVLCAASAVLHFFASVLVGLVSGFGLCKLLTLLQSSLHAPLADAGMLVTAVFAAGAWLLVKYVSYVNERFDAIDATQRALRALITTNVGAQSPPTSR